MQDNQLLLFGGVTAVLICLLVAALVVILLFNLRIGRLTAEKDRKIETLTISNQKGELLAKMSNVLSTTLDYRDVLQKMIDLSLPALGTSTQNGKRTSLGMALLFESDTDLGVAASRNISGADKKQRFKRTAIKLIDEAVQEADTIVSENIQRDKRLASMRSFRNYKSAICAPLRVGLDTYGVMLFATQSANFYQDGHRELLQALCGQVIIPLENAQLIEDLQREQQKILAKEEEARRKLARDLHDGPTQAVSAIAMRLNFVKMLLKNNEIPKAYDEAKKLEDLAQKTVREIRTMLFAMRPVVLETKGLLAALDGFAERINANESFKLIVKNKGYDNHLNTDHEGVLFAIVEEAVGNAKKHAQASEIRINVEVDRQNVLYIEIKDNGVGFDVEKTRATYDQRSSLGMINLFERSEAIGGSCHIDSAIGEGTSVQITVPLK